MQLAFRTGASFIDKAEVNSKKLKRLKNKQRTISGNRYRNINIGENISKNENKIISENIIENFSENKNENISGCPGRLESG